MDLRPYQIDALNKIRREIQQGAKRILLVAPTGAGKTVMGSEVLRSCTNKGNQSLFLAHRRELILQASDKLDRFEVPHGIIMAGMRPSFAPMCQVSSIQTFHSRIIRSKKLEAPKATVVMIDEAHRSVSKTYQDICELYKDSVVIGLTATPVRSDGRGLGSFYDCMVESTSIGKLIDDGFLVPTKIFAPTVPDLTGVGTRAGDYDKEELMKAMDKENLIGDIVEHWLELGEGRPTVVFATGISHSMHIKQRFLNAGVPCDHLDGETDIEERAAILRRLDSGETKVISSVGVLCEGWDQPKVSCCVLARPTKSYGLYLQMAGRILRPAEGKTDSIIIDHGGCVYAHGFPEDAGGWTLDDNEKIQSIREKILSNKSDPVTCRRCKQVYKAQKKCPHCGWEPTKKAQVLNQKEGRLYPVTRTKKTIKTDDKEKFWNSCVYKCKYLNKKIGAAAHMYRKKFGTWPRGFEIMPHGKEEWNMATPDFLEKRKSDAA